RQGRLRGLPPAGNTLVAASLQKALSGRLRFAGVPGSHLAPGPAAQAASRLRPLRAISLRTPSGGTGTVVPVRGQRPQPPLCRELLRGSTPPRPNTCAYGPPLSPPVKWVIARQPDRK